MGQGFFRVSYFQDLSQVEIEEEVKAEIEKQIQEETVVIYSKDYCPYCMLTKHLLSSNNVTNITVREINLEREKGLMIQAILFRITGQKSVPDIFIAGKHIGGNSELQGLTKSGKLKTILDDAGIANNFS